MKYWSAVANVTRDAFSAQYTCVGCMSMRRIKFSVSQSKKERPEPDETPSRNPPKMPEDEMQKPNCYKRPERKKNKNVPSAPNSGLKLFFSLKFLNTFTVVLLSLTAY